MSRIIPSADLFQRSSRLTASKAPTGTEAATPDIGPESTGSNAEAVSTKDRAPNALHRRPTLLHILVPLVLLVILFFQLYLGVRKKSSTLDEQNHIARGLALLRTGDVRLSTIHPPLVNMICALPLLRDQGVKLPLDDSSWRTADYDGFGNKFLWVTNNNGPSIVARARVAIMLLTVLLGALVYVWAYELYGWTAGVLALTLLCFDPNILAHGSLATNDLGMTFFTCLAAYLFWRMLVRPGWIQAAVAGVALGLALTAKFSGGFLLAALPVTATAAWLLSSKEDRTFERLKRLAMLAPAVLGAAFITLWAVYAFQIHHDPVTGFPIPAQAYLDGLQVERAMITRGDRTFLLGMYSQTGWWYYFPVALLVKTPLPTLLFVAGALAYAIVQRAWKPSAILLTPVVIYFALAMNSPLDVGYRHLLPILPFIFIFTGQLANLKPARFQWMKWALALLAVWLVVGTLRICPDYLTYFNEAAGGPSGGSAILADSNLDWGQDLPGLREYMDREKLDSIQLSYFGSAHPEAYGIMNFDPLPSYPYNFHGVENKVSEMSNPSPGVYAISMTNLQGVFFKDHGLYRWFRDRTPDAMIGHSIYVYRVK
jgi:hypothetical protein